MKVFIDKQGGTHYHKEDCKIVTYVDNKDALPFRYEEIEHRLFRIDVSSPYKEYANIIVDGRRYYPCPLCFGHKR